MIWKKPSEAEKIIYFVRHGQSEDNISPVFQSAESPLSLHGKEQAKIVAKRVAKIDFDVLLSSTFPRAKETAQAISETTGKEPEYTDLFVERIKPAEIGGKSLDDEEAKKVSKAWNDSLHNGAPRVPGGENFEDIVARADKALQYLMDRPEKRIVVVTHGYFLRTMIARIMLGDSLTQANFKSFQSHAEIENTGLTVIIHQETYMANGWHLWIYNDHSHLG